MTPHHVNVTAASLPSQPMPHGGRFRWPVIVVGLLVVHVCLMGWAVALATGDRSAIVIPDYYQKSLRWDSDKAERAASQALGWRIVLTPAGQADTVGQVPVLVRLSDATGTPVVADSVELTYCHQAHADRPKIARLVEESARRADGRYVQDLQLGQPGFYSFSAVAKRGKDKYIIQWTQHISAHAEVMP